MTTSRRLRVPRRPAPTFEGQALALAWGAWTELGVSGWASSHADWAIDPEPLIVFTAFLRDRDPRLRDEGTDWCIRNWRHVSKVRLKSALHDQSPETRESFGELAATVTRHAGSKVAWPLATTPRTFTVTGRSAAPALDHPSMAWLRMRAMFGVATRTEVLRYFLSGNQRRASAASIATATGYTKRSVTDECDVLVQAGLLGVRPLGNRFVYSLVRRPELEAFVGALPNIRPDWRAVFVVARELVTLEARAGQKPTTLAVAARKALDTMSDELEDLGVELPPSDVRGADLWPALQTLGTRTLGEWSLGRWHDS